MGRPKGSKNKQKGDKPELSVKSDNKEIIIKAEDKTPVAKIEYEEDDSMMTCYQKKNGEEWVKIEVPYKRKK